ncbi:hypothetical protein NE619_14760, partial [Anaerovorax odorimutans]
MLDLEKLLEIAENGRRKSPGPKCVIFAQADLTDGGLRVEVGASVLTKNAFEHFLGEAYTTAFDRAVKRLGRELEDFAHEIETLMDKTEQKRRASADAGTSKADA